MTAKRRGRTLVAWRRGDPGGMEGSRSAGLAFDLSVAIRRPPPTVFALLADIQDAEPIPRSAAVRMVKEPSGPTTVVTRWHEWVRVAPCCWMRVESVVSQIDEPYQLAMDFRSRWLSGHLTYDIEPAANGSILHQRETVRPRALGGSARPSNAACAHASSSVLLTSRRFLKHRRRAHLLGVPAIRNQLYIVLPADRCQGGERPTRATAR